jgi:ribosomal protein S18 acetylase RimI-like enzyme
MSAPQPTIRRELRPGDLGRVIAHHGRTYAAEYGVDANFEAHVAASVAHATANPGWPSEREGIWIVELAGEHAGSVGLTDEGDGSAVLRWVVLDRTLRGRGLGAQLLDEALDLARRSAYDVVRLETFSDLRAAAKLYRSRGFTLISSDTAPRWGRESVTYQRYELDLQARAHDLSSLSAGTSARPFSVSA